MSLLALVPLLGTLIDKIIPDPEEAAKAKIRMVELSQQQDDKLTAAVVALTESNAATNTAEAASGNGYVAGWRPTFGYIGAAVLGYTYIVGPILNGAAAIWFPEAQVPALRLDDNMWELIIGMLGLAGWRSLDKIKGKAV